MKLSSSRKPNESRDRLKFFLWWLVVGWKCRLSINTTLYQFKVIQFIKSLPALKQLNFQNIQNEIRLRSHRFSFTVCWNPVWRTINWPMWVELQSKVIANFILLPLQLRFADTNHHSLGTLALRMNPKPCSASTKSSAIAIISCISAAEATATDSPTQLTAKPSASPWEMLVQL